MNQLLIMIAAQISKLIMLDTLKTLREKRQRTTAGANLAASSEISGLRILEALNDLEQNTGGRFQMRGFSRSRILTSFS